MLAFEPMQDGTYTMLRAGIALILGLTLIKAQEVARVIENCVFLRSDGEQTH